MSTYLIRRNGRYHFRIRVPKDLQPFIGRREIHRTLATTDRRQARSYAADLRAKIEAEFIELRHHHRLTTQRLLTLSGTQSLGRDPVAALPTRSEQPVTVRARGVHAPQPAPTSSNGQAPALRALIAEFIEERRSAWAPKTRQMHSAALHLFIGFIGDKRVDEITRQDCRAFRKVVESLPANWSKRFKGKSITEIAQMGLEPMSPNTINRVLTPITAFFNWALLEGFVQYSPAQRLRIESRTRPDSERDVFTLEHLRLLFERSPLYRGCRSETQRTKPGNVMVRDAKFWLPLIALYSGMRLEEIAQLHINDIREVDDIWVMAVTSGDGKRIKTTSSERLVPIHSKLVELGLLAYWRKVKERGSDRLWPDLERSTYDSYSVAFSKWFSRYKLEIGITSRKVSFHSLRHTVIDHLKQADVPETKIRELVGHANPSITTGRYGKRYRPEAVKAVVELLDYGLDLAHLVPDGPS